MSEKSPVCDRCQRGEHPANRFQHMMANPTGPGMVPCMCVECVN